MKVFERALPFALLALAMLVGAGCDDSMSAPDAAGTPVVPEEPDLYTDDLPGIRNRGELRALVLHRVEEYLPRDGTPLLAQRRLLRELAKELGVDVRIVPVERFGDLLPALQEGRGDLVAENMTRTPERSQHFAFSSPLDFVREQVVTRTFDEALTDRENLAGRRLAVQRSSAFWARAQKLTEEIPGLELEALDEELEMGEILDGVAAGRIDVTLTDSNFMDAALAWRDDVRVAFSLTDSRIIAWPMRPNDRELQKAVDRFLSRRQLLSQAPAERTPDLEGIRQRGALRVLTRNSDTTYFIWRGQVLGFEYELAQRFADELGVRLEMVVPPSRHDLLPWLLEGRGDLAAAGLTASSARAEAEGVAFSRRYQSAVELLVARADESELTELAQLSGRQVVVRRSSSYWGSLQRLLEKGVEFELVAAPEELETEEILARVASGEFDLSVADSPILDVAMAWNDNLRGAFPIGDEVEYGWAVDPQHPELLAAVDAFFKREYRGLFYNITRRKYFEDPRKVSAHVEYRASRAGRISPWDDEVRKLAVHYGFDWRLIVAQMYQESRFDPKARSFAGARGLLQVMPRTARELGFKSLDDPVVGLEAGVRYLDWTRDRFETDLSTDDRTWFALAAYNVGSGHVNDARRIASDRGWDRDRWFDNVERAMLLKEKPEVHRKTRFGFARGREPVAYVRDIRDRYAAYLEAAGTQAHPVSTAAARSDDE